VRRDVHDAGNERMAWGVATVNSWYRNAKGRASQVWPFTVLDYWRMVREPRPSDFHIDRAPTPQPEERQ
jgi:4-hydroxyacetophenone monooxygenase